MRIRPFRRLSACCLAAARRRPDRPIRRPRIAAQREAMARLAFMDGVWRGPAWTLTPGGPPRAGPDRADRPVPRRLGPGDRGARLCGRRRGRLQRVRRGLLRSRQPRLQPDLLGARAIRRPSRSRITDDRLSSGRRRPGPGAMIRYTATIRDGSWHEIGERIAGGAPPVRDRRDEPAPGRRQRLAGRRLRCRCAEARCGDSLTAVDCPQLALLCSALRDSGDGARRRGRR